MKQKQTQLPDEIIISKIYLIRGQKVMIDHDLASLYGVETKYLKRQVKRNALRFPKDFMFLLTKVEMENLRCQIGTSSWGGIRYSPMVFTEQGVAMLSSILNSDQAITMNIHIIRIFSKLREMLLTHKDILLKLEILEKEVSKSNREIQYIFEALKELFMEQSKPRKRIGFRKD